jgi:hypothetical protein
LRLMGVEGAIMDYSSGVAAWQVAGWRRGRDGRW